MLTGHELHGGGVGADGAEAAFQQLPAGDGALRLPGEEEALVVADFDDVEAYGAAAEDARLDFARHFGGEGVVEVEGGVGEQAGALDAQVLPCAYGQQVVVVGVEHHGVLAEAVQLGAGGEHAVAVAVDALVGEYEGGRHGWISWIGWIL